MKIWYQSVVRSNLYASYLTVLKNTINRIKYPDTQVDIYAIEKVGGLGKQHHYLEYLQIAEILENVERANSSGYDAFIIGHFTDAGLSEARELSNIPIIALGEASMFLACMMGKQFSLIGVDKKSLSLIEDNAYLYRINGRMAPSFTMELDNPLVLESALKGNRELQTSIFSSFECAALRAKEHGAEVVIPAGGVVMALLAKEAMHITTDVNVLNGIAAAVKSAEAVAHLNQLMGGHFLSKALSYRAPDDDEMPLIRQYYGENTYQSLKSNKNNK